MHEVAPEEYLLMWYKALATEHGMKFTVSDPKYTRTFVRDMYVAKQEIADPRLNCLSLHADLDAVTIYLHKFHSAELP